MISDKQPCTRNGGRGVQGSLPGGSGGGSGTINVPGGYVTVVGLQINPSGHGTTTLIGVPLNDRFVDNE